MLYIGHVTSQVFYIGHVTRKSVLYGEYRTSSAFDPPMQNSIYAYKDIAYTTHKFGNVISGKRL